MKFGVIEPQDEDNFVPIEERFFAGGAASVRGWSRSELGPLNSDSKPLGGNSLLEGSLEFRYPIWGLMSGALFGDFGNIWQDSFEHKFNDLRYAAGFGLRFKTPIGPLRLDVARPVFDDDSAMQFYLSVGHAF